MLRLKIDGRWEPQDLIELLRAIESFYYKLAFKRRYRSRSRLSVDDIYWSWASDRFGNASYAAALDYLNEKMLEQARYEMPSGGRIRIAKIMYASPGGIDLLGIGKVFETLANSIGRLKVYNDDARLRSERDAQAGFDTELKRIEVEKERENLQSLKIKNAREALQLLEAHPDMQETLVPLLVRDQDALATKLGEQKLISAKVVHRDHGDD
jgi:hypothetical protein